MKNKNILCFIAVLGTTILIHGCGGYAHMNGQKVSEIIKEDLVRFHYCSSSADCSKQKMVVYDEGVNVLDVSIYADVNSDEIASIVASVIKKAEPGKINMQFVSTKKAPQTLITIDKRAKK
jgi:hypothetical protein